MKMVIVTIVESKLMDTWIDPRHTRIDKIIQDVRDELAKFDNYNGDNKYFYFSYLNQFRNLLWLEEKTIDCCEICTGDVQTPQKATVCDKCYIGVVEDNNWFFEQYFEQKERIAELELQVTNLLKNNNDETANQTISTQ